MPEPNDPPDPWDFPPPSEDPFPDNELDPFPDLPSLFSDDGPFDDVPMPDPFDLPIPFPGEGLQPRPVARASLSSAAASTYSTKGNIMSFPGRYPFPPQATSTRTGGPSTAPACSATNSRTLVFSLYGPNALAFVTTCPYAITSRVTVGRRPIGVRVKPDGSEAWVANAGDGTVSVVNLASKAVTKTIKLSLPPGYMVEPTSLKFHPDGSKAYVMNHDCSPGSFIFVIDTASYNVLNTIPTGCYPSSVAVTPDGSQVWVAAHGDNLVQVFDTATLAPIVTLNGPSVLGITFSPNGARAYYSGNGGAFGFVAVVDTATYAILAEVNVGSQPDSLAVTPTGSYLYVANTLSDSISKINTNSNQVVRTYKVPTGTHHPVGLRMQ